MNKRLCKGFTLVELLAVLVVLTAIMAIGIPVLEKIINKSKDEIDLNSAKNYLSALEVALNSLELDNKSITNSTYSIMRDGSVCIGILTNQNCEGYKLKVDIDKKSPKSGTVTIKEGEIIDLELVYREKTIKKNSKGNDPFFYTEYKIGDEVKFNPGDEERTWNVIDEDKNTVTLLLNSNLGDLVEWISIDDLGESEVLTEKGPITALTYLNTLTTNWTNVDPIDDFLYINNKDGNSNLHNDGEGLKSYGYQKLSIINGRATLTSQSGVNFKIEGKTRARLLSDDEIMYIASKGNTNLTEYNMKAYLYSKRDILNENVTIEIPVNITIEEWVEKIEEILFDEMGYYKHHVMQLSGFLWLGLSGDVQMEELSVYLFPPTWLIQEDNWWTLSAIRKNHAFTFETVTISDNTVTNNTKTGIRPVITIPKSKLN